MLFNVHLYGEKAGVFLKVLNNRNVSLKLLTLPFNVSVNEIDVLWKMLNYIETLFSAVMRFVFWSIDLLSMMLQKEGEVSFAVGFLKKWYLEEYY